jgi:hypothetical protein
MAFTDTWLTTPAVKSVITQAGMRDRVRGDIGMRGQNLLQDTDINAWANEASDLLAQELRWYRAVGNLDAHAGVAEYDFPTRCIAVEEIWHNQLPMRLLNLQDLTVNNYYWRRTGDGVPLFYYVRGNSGFGLTPTPGADLPAGIFVVYQLLPPYPAGDSDFYTVPYAGERALIDYAKLKAAEKDAVGEGRARFEIYTRNWQDSLMAVRKAVESIAEGESAILGADLEPEAGVWRRYWGWDPMRTATPPA